MSFGFPLNARCLPGSQVLRRILYVLGNPTVNVVLKVDKICPIIFVSRLENHFPFLLTGKMKFVPQTACCVAFGGHRAGMIHPLATLGRLVVDSGPICYFFRSSLNLKSAKN